MRARTSSTTMKAEEESLTRQYGRVAAVVSLYWFCSMTMVFLNKYLLSSADLQLDAPLSVTWYQCLCVVGFCWALAAAARRFPSLLSFPEFAVDRKLSREVLPLSVVFVGMITFNNLCLKHVGVSFYYVGRSLTTIFNVLCGFVILGQTTSLKAIGCCAGIIFGFVLGVDQESVIGSLSVSGVLYGVLASLCVALNAIYTKKVLPTVGDNIWRLTLYNNLNAAVLFVPLLVVTGDLWRLLTFEQLLVARFWLLMTAAGACGFAMAYVTGLQIQVTSALTHNISGTAKAAAQTVVAVAYWAEHKSALWWLSNAIVLAASAAYARVKQAEMRRAHRSTPLPVDDARPLMTTELTTSDEDNPI